MEPRTAGARARMKLLLYGLMRWPTNVTWSRLSLVWRLSSMLEVALLITLLGGIPLIPNAHAECHGRIVPAARYRRWYAHRPHIVECALGGIRQGGLLGEDIPDVGWDTASEGQTSGKRVVRKTLGMHHRSIPLCLSCRVGVLERLRGMRVGGTRMRLAWKSLEH